MINCDFLKRTPIAHRGLHDDTYPENSKGAFLRAVENGYAIETDVRLTKDGVLVLFHDDNLVRMTGVDKQVIDCTKEQLDRLMLANSREHIPTLAELLDITAGKVPLLIEIKNVPEVKGNKFLKQVAEEMKYYRGEYAVQSFQPLYVKTYKKLCNHVACGLLATATSSKNDFNGDPLWKLKAYFVKHMSFNFSIKPDFISYQFSDYPTPETDKFTGLKLGWTVRSEEDESYALNFADNIIFENYRPTRK